MANIKPRKSKDGRITSYQIRVYKGRDEYGKQLKPYTMTWKPDPTKTDKQNDKELQKQTIQFEEKCNQGYSLDNKQTFSQYADYVIRQKQRTGVKHTTIARYNDMLPTIKRGIGHIKIGDLRPQHLNALYEQLSQNGLRRNSEKAVCKVDLKQVLKKYAVTKEHLAEKADVSLAVLTSCYNKKPVMSDKARAISEALGAKDTDLFEFVKDDTPLSSKTILEYHRLISTILAQAEKEMLIPYNPAAKASPPKAARPVPNYFQPEQIDAILKALEGEPLYKQLIVHLLLVSGIRRGELAGLRWSCINWERSQIHICHNIIYRKDVGIYTSSPKTNESDRFISLPQKTMELLKEYKAEWDRLHSEYGTMWNEDILLPDEESIKRTKVGGSPEPKHLKGEYLFFQTNSDRVGFPINPDSITSWLNDFSNRHGLPHINPHAFRHTMASILYFSGMDNISISKRMGHSMPSTTSDLYSHLIEEADAKSADKIGEALFGKKDKEPHE